jgi:hypothetical protein
VIRPFNWTRTGQNGSHPNLLHPAQQPPAAMGYAGMQARCALWLLAVCAIDFPTRFTFLLMLGACLLDVWLISRLAQPGEGARAVVAHVSRRFKTLPPQVWLFAGIMLLNLALEHVLVEYVARPFLFNILLLHAGVLLWACLTTPNTRASRASLHRWAMIFICALAALLLLQLLLYNGLGYNLDIRELLSGEASRSGIEEGTEGERPTTIFVEPSCLAITVFTLNFIARLAGPRLTWLTAVAGLTCLLNNSGVGLLLATFLLVEEAAYRLKQHLVLVPVIVLALASVAWLAATLDLGDFKLHALDQIIHPTTRYDPVAQRMYVPLRILNFDALEHLIGTGIANFAAFKDGFTQYDSSFLLAVHYQTGLLGWPMLLLTLFAAWRVHSLSAALTMLALYATKMSLLTPAFWALVALLHYKYAVAPPTTSQRKQRPVAAVWSGLMLSGRIVYGRLSKGTAAAGNTPARRRVVPLFVAAGVGRKHRTHPDQ